MFMFMLLEEAFGLGVGGDCWGMEPCPETFGSCEEPLVGEVIEPPPACAKRNGRAVTQRVRRTENKTSVVSTEH